MVDGVKSVVVRISLQVADEKAFEIIKQYVAEHRLQVRAGRGSRDAEANESHPAIAHERRSPKNNSW
jgi:phage terminase Nu1 subunit (DNA packaging protein)